MIYVRFKEPDVEPRKSWFAKWKQKAQAETDKVIEAAKNQLEYKFKSDLWGELKDYLIELFHEKCAYCEARFTHVAWGDVEHYRPKKKVTDEKNVPIRINGDKPHPGYYWLAYDPSNLLPSCQRCNQARAKMNQFPVAGVRAWRPEDLDQEVPLLLNPYRDRDRISVALKFVPKVGTVEGLDEAGKASVKVYNLNREELIEERRKEQKYVRLTIKNAMGSEDKESIVTLLEECRTGLREFSVASRVEIEDYFSNMGVKLTP